MRADRLVAILLILQSKGRVTAAELADELEISIRTARRDLEALSMSGVPVYPQRGRNGGWQLLGGARTDLTGLTASEVQALFLTVGTSTTASPGLKSAVRKLVQALPETFRIEAEVAAESVVVDPAQWGRRGHDDQPPHLEAIQEAVVRRRQIEVGYATPGKPLSRRVVHPLGLVTKAGVWYLIGDTAKGTRVFRLSRVFDVRILEADAIVPAAFDLEAEWAAIRVSVESMRDVVEADVLVEPWALVPLGYVFADQLVLGAEQSDGRFAGTLTGDRARPIAPKVAGFGRGVEVLGPDSIRQELAALAADLASLYA